MKEASLYGEAQKDTAVHAREVKDCAYIHTRNPRS